jgi:hypothetical protein
MEELYIQLDSGKEYKAKTLREHRRLVSRFRGRIKVISPLYAFKQRPFRFTANVWQPDSTNTICKLPCAALK